MVWNYHDDNIEGAAAPVALTVNGIVRNKVLVHHYRVDDKFSNSFETWKTIGSPQKVSAKQYTELERAGQLQLLTSPQWKETKEGKTVLQFDLPRQAVSLIQLSW